MFRFIHSSDLHLGKPFGQMPDETRGRLIEARFQKLGTLRDLAEQEGASHVLLAGDTFDAETPSPQTRRQALREMAQDSGLSWVILPGNHDSLAADELWRTIREECPANVILALEAAPIPLSETVTLLPAPCPARRAGRDLSAWMDTAETPADHIRIGLAHGGVQSFSEDDATDTIATDRAGLARLDYLGLGDWHGQMSVNPRTWYSGTPETDRFKHDGRAGALVVTVPAPGAAPDVRAVETGQFLWAAQQVDLIVGVDPLPQVEALLPPETARRNGLMQMTLSGRVRPDHRADLLAMLAEAAPDFASFEWRERGLFVEYEADDLDRIDRAGVLRAAAEALQGEAQDDALSAETRDIARRALNRLYSFAVDAS